MESVYSGILIRRDKTNEISEVYHMIYQDIQFHNVAEIETIAGIPGFRLQRFPKEVRNMLGHKEHERGRFYAQKAAGCEIRFVTEASFFRITLRLREGLR